MRAGKGHSSQILAMILSLILAAGSLIMPVFGEQTTQNAEESIVVETDNESEDEAEAPENLEDASETEQESVDESSEDAAVQTEEKEAVSNDNAVETGSSEQATVDSDTDATVEEDLDESSDGQDTQSQSSEEITEEPAQGTVSTEAQYEDAGDLDPISIEDAEVTGITDKIYDGSEQTQTLVVKYGEQTLVENQDYEVYYSNNIEVSGGELRAEVLANYFRHERLPDCTFLPENALYQRTYGTLPEGGVIIQQSHKRSQAARSFAA